MDNTEIKKADTFTLGGKEFTSRFILGSGKFSLDLVKACVEKAGAQIITLALRRANEGGLANILDYIPEDGDTSSEYIRSQKCRRSSTYCQTFQRSRMWKFRQSGSGKRFEISPSG